MADFERFITVVNPVSSQAHKALPRIENIHHHFPNVPRETIETSADGEQTVDDIYNKTEPGDLCLVAGGDGAMHYTMRALVGRDIPLLPMWGGNGNDMAHMLNGNPPHVKHTHELLRRGHAISINPIEIIMSGLKTQYAGAYAGLGLMAEGAEIAKSPTYRSKPGYRFRPVRAAYEAAALAPVTFSAMPFTIIVPGGIERNVTDVSFMNGNRVAKYGRPPACLTEPRAFRVECPSNALAATWIGQLLVGKVRGEWISAGEPDHFSVQQPVRGHVDAETFEVAAGTAITVGIHADSFTAITTRY